MIVEGLVVPPIGDDQFCTKPVSGYYLFFGPSPPAEVVGKGKGRGSFNSAIIETLPIVVVGVITHSVDGVTTSETRDIHEDRTQAATDRLGRAKVKSDIVTNGVGTGNGSSQPSSTNKEQASSEQESGFPDASEAPDSDYPGQIAAVASDGYGYIAFQEHEQAAAALKEGKEYWVAHHVWYAVPPVLITASNLTFTLTG